MITRKERIANAKARLTILRSILDAEVAFTVPMPHGWTKETAIAWQQERAISKYLKNNDRT